MIENPQAAKEIEELSKLYRIIQRTPGSFTEPDSAGVRYEESAGLRTSQSKNRRSVDSAIRRDGKNSVVTLI